MKFSEKLLKNYECKKMTVVRDEDGMYRIFSTKNAEGDFRLTPASESIEEALFSLGMFSVDPEIGADNASIVSDWQIIKTIDFSELGGKGYEVGDWVRVIATGLVETGCAGEIVAISSKMEDEYQVRLPGLDVSGVQERFFFARHEIEPYFEDEHECEEDWVGRCYSCEKNLLTPDEEVPKDVCERLDLIDRKIGIIFEELGITELKCGILSKKKS